MGYTLISQLGENNMTNKDYEAEVELATLEMKIEQETGCRLEVETFTYNALKTIHLQFHGVILIGEVEMSSKKTISEYVSFKGYTHFTNDSACEEEFNKEMAQYRKIKRMVEAFMLTR